jgi:PAS domain S-box-containing protein
MASGTECGLSQSESVSGVDTPAAGWRPIIGRWAFVIAMLAGFGVGAALLPLSSIEFGGAIIALGALVIMALTARRAHLAESKAEHLQRRLDDEASYHAFVDSAVEGFFRTTRDGRYLICNPALAQIYGYESPDHLTRDLTDIASALYVDPERREEFTRLTDKGSLQDFVSQIRRRDGAIIWISENARRVNDADGQFLFYEGTVEDITAKIEADLAMREALKETQEAAHAKAAFLAAMSHELKTPLNAVIGFSDLMKQGVFGPIEPERYRSYVTDIHDNGRRLLGMINDILDLTRIEGRLMELEESEVSVADAVVTVRNAALDGIPSQDRVGVHVPPGLPLLRCDQRRLKQILTHIVSNALKFTGEKGRIAMRAMVEAGGGIAITVEDSGIGMAPEMIQHALEPFKQLDGSLARRFEGAGLGLPLAHALTKLHGGRLSINSTLGVGTTVTIAFPPERTGEWVLASIA